MGTENDDLIYRNNRELFYSFDPETKTYVRRVDYQYSANQVIIKQSWDALEERIEDIKKKIIRGELSPLAYYMEKHQMEIPMLAQYCGIKKRKVKKHLTPKGFAKMTEEEIATYIAVFEISPEQFSNIQ